MNFTKKMYSAKLFWKKNGPKILIYSGVAGGITAGVMACFATIKAKEVWDKEKENIAAATPKGKTVKTMTPDERKEAAKAVTMAAVKTAKHYIPSVCVGTASAVAVLTGCNLMTKNQMAVAAAYSTLSAAFEKYREAVKEKYGEDAEKVIRSGAKEETIEVISVDEDGKEKKSKKKVSMSAIDETSDYARYFDHYLSGYDKNEDYNRNFININQSLANHMLQERGYLFLNEVYDLLTIERTVAGQCVGWIVDGEVSDNYVDFGLSKVWRRNDDGKPEQVLLLDFNVDGNILDGLTKKNLLDKK